MKHTIVSYARKRFEEGATIEQVVEEVRVEFPFKISGYNYIQNLHREFKSGPVIPPCRTQHEVSALYCPDGRRYAWTATDARGAELLAWVLGERAREVGGEWVDVVTTTN